MSDEAKALPSTSDLLRNSLLYRHFQAQREEIMKHKWYESERAGHDIGFELALTDWTIKHYSSWLKKRQSTRSYAGFPYPE
jgi:Domain of unknown function (DUF4032)